MAFNFFFFFQENTEPDNFAATKPKHMAQPFLLCLGTMSDPKLFFLILDGTAVPCGPNFTNAFKVLFASYFTFNVDYPTEANEFYQFFEFTVFKLVNQCCPTVSSFTASLDCLPPN